MVTHKSMETHANKSRMDNTFYIDEWVFLRLQPYRQHSVQARHSHCLIPPSYIT